MSSSAGISSGDTERLFEMMIPENRWRNEVLGKLVDRISPQTSPVIEVQTPLASNRAVMPEVLRNIKTFNGDRVKVKVWLDTLISAETLHQLPGSYLLETARTRLTDGAKFWYEAKNLEIVSWEIFVDLFKLVFIPRGNITSTLRELNMCIQKKM
nr:unnamed protein product [Callosobruchus analis]